MNAKIPARHLPADPEHLLHLAHASEAADLIFRALLRSARAAGLSHDKALSCASRAAASSTGVDVLAELGMANRAIGLAVQPTGGGGLPVFINEWKAGRLPVPYSVCRSGELYRAYLIWCQTSGQDPLPITKFAGRVEQAMPGIVRAFSKVDGRNARLLIPAGQRLKYGDGKWMTHAGLEATQFRRALLAWEAA